MSRGRAPGAPGDVHLHVRRLVIDAAALDGVGVPRDLETTLLQALSPRLQGKLSPTDRTTGWIRSLTDALAERLNASAGEDR